jgi:hypothetical protein
MKEALFEKSAQKLLVRFAPVWARSGVTRARSEPKVFLLLFFQKKQFLQRGLKMSVAVEESSADAIDLRVEFSAAGVEAFLLALDRARLRQTGRLIAHEGPVAPGMPMEIEAAAILASRVFAKDTA